MTFVHYLLILCVGVLRAQSSGTAVNTTLPGFSLSNDQVAQLQNYQRISQDCQRYEDAYKDCLDAIPTSDYSETTINECVGPNFSYVINDLDFERRKILAAADKKVRNLMIQLCYTVAGLDTVMSSGCDLIERDALDLLWADLNFRILLDYNSQKYLFEYGQVPETVFQNLMSVFTDLYKNFDVLVTEVDNHKDLTLVRLKEFIDNKTKAIVQLAAERQDHPLPKITTQTIQVTQTVNDPNSFNLLNLPRPIVQDTSNNASYRGGKGASNQHLSNIAQTYPNAITEQTGLEPTVPITMYSASNAGSLLITAERHLLEDKKSENEKEKVEHLEEQKNGDTQLGERKEI